MYLHEVTLILLLQGETSEIWTPDVELWNLDVGLKDSFEDAYARVTNDGVVLWSRPGHLKPTCKFDGLDSFPFDKLTCTMEFGSWMHTGKYIRMEMLREGFFVGGSETSGAKYVEYSLAETDPVTVEKYTYPPFIGSPSEYWPVLLYNVTIARSWEPYARGYIATQSRYKCQDIVYFLWHSYSHQHYTCLLHS